MTFHLKNLTSSLKYIKSVLVVCLASAFFLTGCGNSLQKQIVLTSDFTEGEVFRIEGMPCTKSEIMVYLANSQNQYSKVFGSGIWDTTIGDSTLKDNYKDTILARIAQIKAMNLLAKEREIEISEEEEGKIIACGSEYFESLTDADIQCMGCDLETVQNMYREFLVASKLYDDITKDVNPEISDDEARSIVVNTILIKTYSLDSEGNKVPFDANKKADAYNRIQDIKNRIEAGETFEVLMADYNEDSQNEYCFGRDVMPKEFEDVAFSLENGQISDIVETEYGYHLIRCISTFNPEETDANKEKIVLKRKQEAFDSVYGEYVKTLTSNLNQPLWDSIDYDVNGGSTTTGFFEVYNSYFG